jgi:aminoglycoside phosphotransferase (APT) family kinase protein
VEHRDFSPWNVLVGADGALAVLDWESADLDGVAGPDLVYFLSHLAFYRAGLMGWRFARPRAGALRQCYRDAWDPAAPDAAHRRACLARYAEAVGVPSDTLGAVRLLTWMIHTRSEHRQLQDDGPGAPAAAALGRGLFFGLLLEEIAMRRAGRA